MNTKKNISTASKMPGLGNYRLGFPKIGVLMIPSILSVLISIPAFAQNDFLPGQTFRDCPDCPEMIMVAGGSLMMGSPENELGRYDPEGPQRSVTIRQFAVGKFDMTRGQWAAFAKATNRPISGGCAWSGMPGDDKPWELNPAASWDHLGFPQDDNYPVVCVTWYDAQDYVKWLRQKTGGNYRLLTESEWEYAARAGTATPYPWGPGIGHENANYGKDTCCSGLVSGKVQWEFTSPVGSFLPNDFGLYEMHGNVLQYVEDCLSSTYSGLPTDGSAYKAEVALEGPQLFPGNLTGTSSCAYRIVRGGDYGNPPNMIRSASRNYAPGPGATLQQYRSGGVDFRVAKTL